MSLRRAAALIPALAALAACVVGPGVASANPLGDLVRVSELEAGGDGGAYDVQVEYNAGTSEYLVSWTADGIFSPFEDEVYVQRLSAAGAEIGPDRAISAIGPPGDTQYEPFASPTIAADHVNRRNLVVWAADHDSKNAGYQIYGQLLGPDGEQTGVDDFKISLGPRGANYPEVAFNPGTTAVGDEEYLVVWTSPKNEEPVQWGRRLDEDGTPIGEPFQISEFEVSGRTSLPRIAYNEDASEYLVVWYQIEQDDDSPMDAYGRRIDADGALIGEEIPLTDMAATTADDDAAFPAISANPINGTYLLTYQRLTKGANPTPPPDTVTRSEVVSRVLSATAVPQGTPLRLSPEGIRAAEPVPAYATAPAAGQYLVMWAQDSPPPGLFDREVWGRRVGHDGAPLAEPFRLFAYEEALTFRPWVAARTDALEWLAVWSSDCPRGEGVPPQDLQAFGRRVDAGSAPTGDGVCRLPGDDPDPEPTPMPEPSPTASPEPSPAPAPQATPAPADPGTPPPAVPTPAPTPAPAKLKAADVFTLPSSRRCLSRRRFRIRLRNPRGTRIVRAEVRVNGKRVRTLKGRRVTAKVDLRGLPRGRYKVKVRVTLADGRKVSETRRYRTCAPRRR